jgi:hypothetical protein
MFNESRSLVSIERSACAFYVSILALFLFAVAAAVGIAGIRRVAATWNFLSRSLSEHQLLIAAAVALVIRMVARWRWTLRMAVLSRERRFKIRAK